MATASANKRVRLEFEQTRDDEIIQERVMVLEVRSNQTVEWIRKQFEPGLDFAWLYTDPLFANAWIRSLDGPCVISAEIRDSFDYSDDPDFEEWINGRDNVELVDFEVIPATRKTN